MKRIGFVVSGLFLLGVLLVSCQQEKGVFAEINTNKGKIVAFLEFQKVPMTVANFVGLAEGSIENATIPLGQSYFENAIIHRVVEGHVIQGGSPPVEDNKGTGYRYPNEIHPDLSHNKPGMLGVANGGPHTNSDEFYITLGDRSYLDGDYTVFGHVTEGMDVLMSIKKGDLFESIRIVRKGREARKFKPDTEMFKKLVEEQWEKVRKSEAEKRTTESQIITKRWPDAITLESGTKYIIRRKGKGLKASEGTVIKLKYEGELFNGVKFVSSENGKPSFDKTGRVFEFTPGESSIIPAINEALVDMVSGEVRLLIVQADQGYGSGGYYGKSIPGEKRFVISPNTTLIYEIEVVEIRR